MHDAGWWEPAGRKAVHSPPVGAVPLAATLERPLPVSRCLGSKGGNGVEVAGHAIIIDVSAYHGAEPAALLRNRQVPTSQQLGFYFEQL